MDKIEFQDFRFNSIEAFQFLQVPRVLITNEYFKDLSKCKKIYLLHLSNDNSDKMIMKTEIQKITGCEVWCE